MSKQDDATMRAAVQRVVDRINALPDEELHRRLAKYGDDAVSRMFQDHAPRHPKACQCSLAIRLVGDGCRYCQPDTYIDTLEINLKEATDERDALYEENQKLRNVMEKAKQGLNEIISMNKAFRERLAKIGSKQ